VNLSFTIAARYLFSKKTHNAINVVSMISVFGVTVAVAALICTLSVYNGFQQLLGGLYSNFDPQIKIKVTEGKVFDPETREFGMIKNSKYVDVFCESLEENALLIYKDAQTSAIIKGVPDNYNQLTSIEKLIRDREFFY
jgi:lipoprotein-releasing system permease protein